MLWSGWQNEFLESIGAGSMPWIEIGIMVAWYYFLKHNMVDIYTAVEDVAGPVVAGPGIAWSMHMVIYHVHAGIYQYMDTRKGWWTAKKISSYDKITYAQMVPNVVKNQVIFLIGGIAAYYASGGRGWNRAKQPYAEVPWSEMLFDQLMMYLVYEAIFYTNHRVMHITDFKFYPGGKKYNLYALFHKKHHLTYASVGVSGLYMTSVDCFLSQTLPQIVGPALFDFHPMVMWLGAMIGTMNSVHTHSGYDLWGLASPHGHELHHSRYKVNYGTGILDRILNTRLEEHEVVREGFGMGGRLVKDLQGASKKME